MAGGAPPRDLTGDELERMGLEAYLAADYKRSLEFYESAYAAYRTEGEVLAAVRIARTIAYFATVHGDWAIQSGWISRARSLLTDAGDDDVERAWVQLFDAFASSEPDAQERALRRAAAAGRELGDPDLEIDARSLLGQHLVATGRTEEGMRMLDEALAADGRVEAPLEAHVVVGRKA